MSANIDSIAPKRGLIDLSDYKNDEFTLGDYKLSSVLNDVILAEYVDCSADGREINRGGVIIPVNAVSKAWRLGKVVLKGTGCEMVNIGDIVCFPADRGIAAKNMVVEGHGKVINGIFLNEDRIFGVCVPLTEDES
jgi:hypothetical protein